MKCDILYLSGALDYGESVSGNYILYKLLKQLDGVSLKVLPLFSETKQDIDYNDFLNSGNPTTAIPESLMKKYYQNIINTLISTLLLIVYKYSRLSSMLLVPLLLWLSFASVLNYYSI